MGTDAIIEFLKKNDTYLTTNNFLIEIFRQIGWWFAKFLHFLLDAVITLYNWTFGLVNITSWTNLTDFLKEFNPIITTLLTLSLSILGLMFILGKHKKHTLLSSFLILAVVVTSSSYLFSTLNTLAISFKDAVITTEEGSDSNVLISENLYDLIHIDKEIGLSNMKDGNMPQEAITNETLGYMDFNELINYNSDKITTDNAKEILKQRLDYISADNYALQEVSNGWGWNDQDSTDLGNEFYYRYHFDFLTFYLTAAASILLYFCLSYKNTRIIYELFVSRILTTFFSTDLSSNQKIVKILTGIRDGYYALCFTALSIKSFMIFQDYLNTRTEINVFAKSIILLFLAWCVIDGANIMEKITGVDAGLTSASGKLIAGIQMARGVQQASRMKSTNKHLKAGENARSNMSSESRKSSGMGTFGNMNDELGKEGKSRNNQSGVGEDKADTNKQNMDQNNENGNNGQEDTQGFHEPENDQPSMDQANDVGQPDAKGNMNQESGNFSSHESEEFGHGTTSGTQATSNQELGKDSSRQHLVSESSDKERYTGQKAQKAQKTFTASSNQTKMNKNSGGSAPEMFSRRKEKPKNSEGNKKIPGDLGKK